jgi:hypothetical protein
MRHVVSLVAVVPVVYLNLLLDHVVVEDALLLLRQDQDLYANSIIIL